ncbi:response regulator transcription factor [Ructibacterium gallinarum]|uniref:Stage 0 sporulation protein A homolog n=1 Tax=Ructibacterium gallinarum TaxID=2779355 RepID=A0A9D5M7C5_9FIRM|nr:helix-turn-helix domain-containing protein [Ructibacterium gallinarum]MBE5040892.1 helix-turn-helix domain-containing protein [Ructibacterium gallinarum]
MKLLVIEDELLCLQALTKLPWESIDISLVGAVQNIDDAIKIIKETHPDIILSDIRMPNGSGIDLAKYLYNVMPNTKIIFLTAYNDFEYVKQAFSLNVFDYLLKPLDVALILDTVCRAKHTIEESLKKELTFMEMEKQIENSIQFMKGYFFGLIEKNASLQNDMLRMFHIENTEHIFSVFTVKIYDDETLLHNPFLYHKVFRELNKVLISDQFLTLAFFEDHIFTFVLEFLSTSDINNALELTMEYAEIAKNYLEFNINAEYSIGVSKPVHKIENLGIADKRAQEALKYNFRIGNNQILYIEDIEPTQCSIEFKTKLEGKYIDAIKIGDEDAVAEILKELFDSFQSNFDKIETVQRICLEFIVKLSLTMIQFNLDPNVLFNKTNIWSVVERHQTLDELHKFLLDITLVTMSQISVIMVDKDKKIVHQVKEFLKNNFQVDVSLTGLAKELYVSPSYLSAVFTKEAGISFKKYLTNLRIERAKYLLANTDLSIGKIAEQVGYNTQAYFSKQFHAATNMLPSLYRNEHTVYKK